VDAVDLGVQVVENPDPVVLFQDLPGEMGADESGSACDEHRVGHGGLLRTPAVGEGDPAVARRLPTVADYPGSDG
jgi:hypothetical protein